MKVRYATINEKGIRYCNEDSFNIVDMQDNNRWMGIVSDGMGGHSFGDIASKIVVDEMSSHWNAHVKNDDEKDWIVNACQETYKKIEQKSDQFRHCEMGATMVMACLEGNKITIAHLGDSRCYYVRKKPMNDETGKEVMGVEEVYRTKDHLKPGGELIAKCFFSYHPEIVEPEIVEFEVKPGDRFLLCTDGLYMSTYPHVLCERMMDDKTPDAIIDTYAFLCEKFSKDNYTGVLVMIDE